MFSIGPPSLEQIQALTHEQAQADLTYSPKGLSLLSPPPGFNLDDHSVQLGQGEACWQAATAALHSWTMFDQDWVTLQDRSAPHPGQVVPLLFRSLGLWVLVFNRVVSVERSEREQAFTYGTLPEHAECGEERFSVRRDDRDQVTFSVRAVSRPRHWMARLGKPWTRSQQKRFANGAMAAMQRATR